MRTKNLHYFFILVVDLLSNMCYNINVDEICLRIKEDENMKSIKQKYEDLISKTQALQDETKDFLKAVRNIGEDMDMHYTISESFQEQGDYLQEVISILDMVKKQIKFAKEALPEGVAIYIK